MEALADDPLSAGASDSQVPVSASEGLSPGSQKKGMSNQFTGPWLPSVEGTWSVHGN